MQKTLIAFGLLFLILGVAWPWLQKIGLGRLPGDIVIEYLHPDYDHAAGQHRFVCTGVVDPKMMFLHFDGVYLEPFISSG